MITMNKTPACPWFSYLEEHPLYSSLPYRHITANCRELGFIIADCLNNFSQIFGAPVEIYDKVIMPDHIHFILRVTSNLERHLSDYLYFFKNKVYDIAIERALIPNGSNPIFEYGYNDQFLTHDRSLDVLKKYIRNNPYNLWVRSKNPLFFERRVIEIKGEACQSYGNHTFLENPFIFPVIFHRKYKNEMKTWEKLKRNFDYVIDNGGVIASAFVNEREKEIFKAAIQRGGKIIYFSNNFLEDRAKPSGEIYELCKRGQMLRLSPMAFKGQNHKKSPGELRQDCLLMNRITERLSTHEKNRGALS